MSEVITYYSRILGLNFALQDAMSEPTGADKQALADSDAFLDTLIGPAAQNCWNARPGSESGWDTFLVYGGSQFVSDTTCGQLDQLTAETLNDIATRIQGIEPGLAEVARALAVEAAGAVERIDEIVPDTPSELWTNTDDRLKTGLYIVGALVLWRALR